MEMQLQVEQYEQILNRTQSDSMVKESNQSTSYMNDDAPVQEDDDEVDQPNDQLHRVPTMNRHPFHISLRSRAEEDIVNDAKRKKTMLHMCEQPLNTEKPMNCSSYSIVQLKGLRHLNVASCNRISDVSLKYAFDFIELETLNLSKCQQISAIGIERVLVKCPSIKVGT